MRTNSFSFLLATFLLAFVLTLTRAWGETYQLDLTKTTNKVTFLAVGRPSAIKIRGRIKDGSQHPLTGQLKFSENTVLGEAQFRLNCFDTGIGLRNRHMKEKYLETDKFSHAKIQIKTLSLPEGFSGEDIPFSGSLTLHGVTKPIKGKVEIERDSEEVEMQFSFKLKIDDYAIDIPSYLGIKVADEVTVGVEIQGVLAQSD